MAELRADESISPIRSVHMQPQAVLFTNRANFMQVVKRTARRRPQSSRTEKRDQPDRQILFYRLLNTKIRKTNLRF